MSTHFHPVQARFVETADGRRLRVEVAGDCRRVIVVLVGTPNAGVLYQGWVEDAAARGLTLIAYDRPGYGDSTAQAGRSVSGCAADMRAISDAVGFGRCAVWGFSGGGPHALACGALLDDLVAAVATIGSPAPFDAPDLDFFAGMPDGSREDHELFLSDRAEWDRQNERQRDQLLALSVHELRESWAVRASQADAEVLRGDIGGWLHEAVRAALEPGVGGWADDDIALHLPWGFDPASISLPVKVWHSRDDRFVPIDHARWLRGQIPGAQAELGDDDGHFTVVARRIADVHDWLARYQ